MIADELANSRGLRLSDSPITSEAALLSRLAAVEGLRVVEASLEEAMEALPRNERRSNEVVELA